MTKATVQLFQPESVLYVYVNEGTVENHAKGGSSVLKETFSLKRKVSISFPSHRLSCAETTETNASIIFIFFKGRSE
jgi:hypothetical protein